MKIQKYRDWGAVQNEVLRVHNNLRSGERKGLDYRVQVDKIIPEVN